MDGGTDSKFERTPPADAPYSPGWLDRVTDGVRRLPLPFALVYLVLGLTLSLIRSVIGWIDGSYPVGTFFRVHVIDGLNPVYLLFAIHLLDNMAHRALSDYRTVLRGDAASHGDLRYRLTTMPALPSVVLGVTGLVLGAIYMPLLLSPVDLELSMYFTSTAAVVADTALSAFLGVMMVMFGFHAFHQLRMIARIYSQHTNVNIFDVGPLHALSHVTAVTSVALLIFSYVYLAFYGNWQINSVSNSVLLGVILLVALLTFIVPLYGSHGLLKRAKNQRLSEIARRIEAAADSLHGKADAGDYSDEIGHIDGVLDGLLKERAVVAKASTWPWDPEAVRAVITALLLPIFLWFVTRILERLGV